MLYIVYLCGIIKLLKNTMIKTKKIAAGYYEGRYNDVDFTIQKVSLPNSEISWYWQIGNETVDDWHKSKFQAIQAVKSYIEQETN